MLRAGDFPPSDDGALTESELSAVIVAGVNKNLRVGKITPHRRQRRRRRASRLQLASGSVCSLSSIDSYCSSHGSLLDEVIGEEGELNSSPEVAATAASDGAAPALTPRRKKSGTVVPVFTIAVSCSPEKPGQARSRSRGGAGRPGSDGGGRHDARRSLRPHDRDARAAHAGGSKSMER